jgi:signal transduction histidine kinase
MPRNGSPCGITIDRDASQLMYLPQRFFPALKVEPPVVEALLVPFHFEDRPIGTVWVVAHTSERKFDKEDERLVKTLANFAAAGWQLWKAREGSGPGAAMEKRDPSCSIEIEDEPERRLQHSHKLESLGMPAVGIAHDFNNLLNIIQSYVTIMEFDLENTPALKRHLEVIKQTVQDGAALTHQLLTVARKNSVDFELTNINALIMKMARWLESTLPKSIRVECEPDLSIPDVEADPNQLNQLLLNLCLNARDAVGDAGTVRLSTALVAGNELRQRFAEAEDRNYVCIAIADTGPGMDENVRQHIFEPFFTTKEESKGTGLGLAIVHGIVTTHHGFVDVDTQPGQGTTFYVYLPVAR